jgi:hypothetical protein
MKIQHLLAAATALLAIGVAGPTASAQDADTATIKIQNNSAWTLDCTVFWGNNRVSFDGVAPSSGTDEKILPISDGGRNLVCKKKGAPANKSNVSPIVKFKSDTAGAKLTATCANGTGDTLTCSVGSLFYRPRALAPRPDVAPRSSTSAARRSTRSRRGVSFLAVAMWASHPSVAPSAPGRTPPGPSTKPPASGRTRERTAVSPWPVSGSGADHHWPDSGHSSAAFDPSVRPAWRRASVDFPTPLGPRKATAAPRHRSVAACSKSHEFRCPSATISAAMAPRRPPSPVNSAS